MKGLFTKVWTKLRETKKPIARSLQHPWAETATAGTAVGTERELWLWFRRSPPDRLLVEEQLARQPRGKISGLIFLLLFIPLPLTHWLEPG